MIASPPVPSTLPLHKSWSLPCWMRSISVAMTWNFRLELPAFSTSTFIGNPRGHHEAARRCVADLALALLFTNLRNRHDFTVEKSRSRNSFVSSLYQGTISRASEKLFFAIV